MTCDSCEYCNSNGYYNSNVYHKKNSCNYGLYNVPERISVQGFHSCNCCDYDCNDVTTLVPVTLFQCNNPCTGMCFTNCVNGVLDGCKDNIYSNNEFSLISSFSNFSIIGLTGVCKVSLQYYLNPYPICNPCAPCNVQQPVFNKGPTVQGVPLGKLSCSDAYTYQVSNDCFKFGPVHLGVDNWLQAIPECNNYDKGSITNINVAEGCSKACKPYEIFCKPLQIKATLYSKCRKCPVHINFCVYILAKEGTCVPIAPLDCDDTCEDTCIH